MEVPDARLDDPPEILDIFNEVIANSTAAWFDSLDDLEVRRRWYEARQVRDFPILVAVEAGGVLAIALSATFARGTVIVTRSSTPSM